MKQTTKTVLLALACAALAACGAKSGEKESGDGAPKSAVVFYSQNGATRALAGLFAEATGAAVVELKLVEPYPSTYDSTIAAVREECETGRWPALAEAKPDLAKYDTLYLGYPIMFGPLPVRMTSLPSPPSMKLTPLPAVIRSSPAPAWTSLLPFPALISSLPPKP